MDQGDIIRITDVQQVTGYTDPILNVFYYRVFTLTASVELPVYAQELAEAFYLSVLQHIVPIQSSSLSHVRLDFMNMSFQQEIASHAWDIPYVGLDGGPFAPANVSYSFRLVRYNRLTRNGRKSISGVPVDAITSGRTLTPVYVGAVSACATALGSSIAVEGETTDATLTPIIVRVPPNPGTAPTVTNPITMAVYRGFGTQNSRKAL